MLRDTIEELQERVTNVEDELMHKSRDYSKLSREHQNTCADLSKSLYIITERERILDEHGINLDGSIKEGYTAPTSPSSVCELCQGGGDELNGVGRGAMMAEITSLRNELRELRGGHVTEESSSVNVLESFQTEHSELDQSFADVSNEAAVIRDDALHTGMYINNNEKNDDFEMIDNGLQQDELRHFEDQSYEKSSSSLTSSMMTDTGTSIESSLPLEINVEDTNQGGKGVTRDYDIVQVEDSKSSTSKAIDINVDSYTNLDYNNQNSPSKLSSSGSITSSINVNKYLFDDQEEPTHEETEEYSVFSVNRYFASESPVKGNSSNDVTTVGSSTGSSHQTGDDNIELQTSVDTITNVQSDYDTIDTEDVFGSVDARRVCEENHDSPYEDVQEESARLINDNNNAVTPVEKSPSCGGGDISGEMTVLQTHMDTDLTSQSAEQFNATVDVISPSTEQSTSPDLSQVASTQNTQDVVTQNTAVSTSNSAVLVDPVAVNGISEEAPFVAEAVAENVAAVEESEQETIRDDVEELYDQIANETKEDIESEELNVTWDVQCESSPKTGGPVIQVTDTEPSAVSSTTTATGEEEPPAPKAKERKSKKKKKKGEKVGSVEVIDNDSALGAPVLSDPLLLGFAEPDKPPAQPHDENDETAAQKSTDKSNRSKSDIPKQFLDASADLIGTSGSDFSDAEDGYLTDEGEGEGKHKSSKWSKKDGCKSQ